MFALVPAHPGVSRVASIAILLALIAIAPALLRAQATERQTSPLPPAQPAPPLVEPEALRRGHAAVVNAAAQLLPRATLAELLRRTFPAPGPGTTNLEADHRGALLALAFYVNGWPLSALVAEANSWPVATRRSITLAGRGDLAQHFIVSAAIAAAAGSPLADAAGLYKEIRDAQDGSGFSFSDLAADRAGTLFGELATMSPDSAARWRLRVGGRLIDADLMPPTAGLPDGLRQSELADRFGGVGGDGYKALVTEIDRRIAELEFYRPE